MSGKGVLDETGGVDVGVCDSEMLRVLLGKNNDGGVRRKKDLDRIPCICDTVAHTSQKSVDSWSDGRLILLNASRTSSSSDSISAYHVCAVSSSVTSPLRIMSAGCALKFVRKVSKAFMNLGVYFVRSEMTGRLMLCVGIKGGVSCESVTGGGVSVIDDPAGNFPR